MTYPLRTLDELGFVGRGRSRHRPRDAVYLYGGPYPFIQTGDVKGANFYVTEYSQTYSEAGLAQSKLWDKGTLCITIAANIAETAILGIDACFPDSIIGFIANEDKADVRYIKYLFNDLQKQYQQYSQGAAQDNLSQQKLLSLKFPVPPPNIQRKSADILSAYDDLIENNRRRIALLERSAQLLYQEWFVHLRFPGHEHVRVVDGVPEGWAKVKLSKLVDTQYGFTESAVDEPIGPKFLRGKDINKVSHIEWNKVPYCTRENLDFKKFRLEKNDILVIRMADPGKVGIVEEDVEAVFASYLVRLKLTSSRLSPYYLFYSLSDNAYQDFISGASTGSTRKSASAKLMVNYYIVLPTPSLMETFEEWVMPARQQITNLLHQNAKLQQARDLLLPRLMSGEVQV